MELRFTEPLQHDLYKPQPLRPERVADVLFQFMEVLNTGTPQQLEQLVPDSGYRAALLRLTRNVAPAGKRVKEIGLYRARQGMHQAVYLTSAVADRVKHALPPKERVDEPRREIQGVLRALHLDENWLEVTLADGSHEKCGTQPDMLDDVVGPMVNRLVTLSGPVRRVSGGVRRLVVEDIELVGD